jgi:hypothetical protein
MKDFQDVEDASFLLTTYHKGENAITSKNNIIVNVINYYGE